MPESKKMLSDCTITTLSEYQDVVNGTYECWKKEKTGGHFPHIWFRGQPDKPLIPKVLRKVKNINDGNECNYNEYRIFNAFSALYKNYTSERFIEKSSEFYSFMQHYGVPTRLLDWTENAAIALYIAVTNDIQNKREYEVVWIMNPGAMNKLTTSKLAYAPILTDNILVQIRMKMVGYLNNEGLIEKFWRNYPEIKEEFEGCNLFEEYKKYIKFPLAFYPISSGNIRIATQKGCFTIHGTDKRAIEEFFLDNNIQKYLIKVKIYKESFSTIREQLRLIGLTARSMFPDLYGLASELCGPDYLLM